MHGESSKIENSDTRQDALLSHRSAQQNKADTKKFRCEYCKKKGHFVKDCYKKKADAKKSSLDESANRVESMQESKVKSPEVALSSYSAATPNEWWIDSGASKHMNPDKKEMTSYIAFRNPAQVKLADNRALYAYGKGTVNISVFDGAKKVNLALHDVLYIPKIRNK